ncbi:putative quinol monooxygenase [Nocardia rhizosphaerihabitans]|uniref:putative quinol monooxygenase n=1 Tax=Nocardia rhizosphaerihabitans TaxID=1691570 RepID=UPI0016654C60|nr:putative quinol monooxygenase [Nocardia rhizosphaerihabitans]
MTCPQWHTRAATRPWVHRSGSAGASATSRSSSPGKRAEEGCLEYHSHVDNIDPSVFVFYEVWRSSEDLDRHLALPHLREFWESRMDYLTRDLDIRFVDMLSPYPR